MKRPIIVGVRVSTEEHAALEQLAEECERTIPDTLRWLARRATKEQRAPTDRRQDGALSVSTGS